LSRIRREARLQSAAALMLRANAGGLLSARRGGHLSIELDGETILLRDQAPLHAGNIRFEAGWDLPRLIEHLNRRVFFWPGGEDGPIAYGRRHHERYAAEAPVVLRVRLRELLEANPGRVPLFCQRNSGSPRTVNGKKSPRGSDTFVTCENFPRGPRGVVEVTFEDEVVLPPDTEFRLRTDEGWAPLVPPA